MSDYCLSGLVIYLAELFTLFLFTGIFLLSFFFRKQRESIQGVSLVLTFQSAVLLTFITFLHFGIIKLLSIGECSEKFDVEGFVILLYIGLSLINTIRVVLRYRFYSSLLKKVYFWAGIAVLFLGNGYFWFVIFPSF